MTIIDQLILSKDFVFLLYFCFLLLSVLHIFVSPHQNNENSFKYPVCVISKNACLQYSIQWSYNST